MYQASFLVITKGRTTGLTLLRVENQTSQDAGILSGLDAGILSPGLDAGILQVLKTQSRQRFDLFIEHFVSHLPCLAFRASPSASLVQHDSKLHPCLAFRAFAPTARLIQFDYRTLQQQLNYVIPLQISPSLPISPASSGPNASPRQVQPHSPVPRPSVLPSFSASP